jgi:hypothetical protein
LDEGGAEEVVAAVAFGGQPEGFFERRADLGETGESFVLDAGFGFAGVRGEEPSDVGGTGEGRGLAQGALEILDEPLPEGLRRRVRERGELPEGRLAGSDLEALARDNFAVVGAGNDNEFAQVGDEDLAVASGVSPDLFAGRDLAEVVGGPFRSIAPRAGVVPRSVSSATLGRS